MITISSLVTLLIWILVIALLVWLVFWVLAQFNPPEPIGKIVRVAVVVIAALILISLLMQVAGVGWHAPIMSSP